MAKQPEPAKAVKPEVLVPKKARSPISNPIKGRTLPAPKPGVTLTNVPEINSLYNNFKTRLPAKTKHGINIGKIESAKRKSDLIQELIYAINDGQEDLGLSPKEWVALATRAYYKYMDEYGPIVEVSPNVIDGVKELIEKMFNNKNNFILPDETDADKIVRLLNKLKSYRIDSTEIVDVDIRILEEALNRLETSIENFKNSPFPPGSPKFSRQGTYILATRAFIELGLVESEAKNKANVLFSKMQ